MLSLAEHAMVGQRRAGNDVRPWGMSGFDGFICGPIQIGTRGVETIVRLTGEYASSNWRRFYALADGCSRLDLQVTVDTHRKASTVVAKHYRQAARARGRNKNFPKVWECRDSNGPATLYFGKRVSALFGRVYDKFSESQAKWPEGAVRFELQHNGKAAKLIASKLFRARSEKVAIADRVSSYFRNHGLTPLWPIEFNDNYNCPRRRSDDDKRLAWLQAQVRPSVAALVAAGKTRELLEALNLTVLKSGRVVTVRIAKAS